VREINGETFLNVGDIAKKTKRSNETINIWYKHSTLLRKSGKKAPIPECIRINGIKYWTLSDVEKIVEFSKNIKPGYFASYNRKYSWGERGKLIQKRMDEKKKNKQKEITRYQELSIVEKEKLDWEKRFKYIKQEAKRMPYKPKSI
jgi:hypothetical protein